MSMLAALAKKWHYSVENPGGGRLLYREGNREYTFPLYEENGVVVLVGVPSSQRIHFFFNWYWHPAQEFSAMARARILPRIEEHLRAAGARVRVFERNGRAGGDFDFYPELFADRARASEALEEAGYTWFCDYSAIDLLHEEYGLEVCGLQTEQDARAVAEALRDGFPHWHHQNICLHEQERDPGWAVSLCLFPSRPCNSGWYDGD
ncbi:MAG: hypothetical protein JWQ04_1345 [Pedosphaera sp.]|nr:hypothetical protein [Pedosphaera sp.]